MRSPEELQRIQLAVLAECERVCPTYENWVSLNPMRLVRIRDQDMRGYNLGGVEAAWAIMHRTDIVCFIYDGTDAALISFAYRLLGLEARDAVHIRTRDLLDAHDVVYKDLAGQYRQKLDRKSEEISVLNTKLEEAANRYLKDLPYMHTVLNEKQKELDASEARSAKLVEALEEIVSKDFFTNRHASGKFANIAKSALAAYKEGGQP